jgi:hypothetical protein
MMTKTMERKKEKEEKEGKTETRWVGDSKAKESGIRFRLCNQRSTT